MYMICYMLSVYVKIFDILLCYVTYMYHIYNTTKNDDTKGKIFWKVLVNYKLSLLSKHIGSKQKIFTD